MSRVDLRDLEKYATTEKQLELIAAAKQSPTLKHAADLIGMKLRQANFMLKRCRDARDAAEAGAEHPNQRYILPGQRLKGQSTLTKAENGDNVWIKTERDPAADIEFTFEALKSELLATIPPEPPQQPPAPHEPTDLCNLFIVTDYHLGMKAWGEETGHNWDLKIAEDLLVAWFAEAIRKAPEADQAIFAQLGDFLHYDGIQAITPTSGHIVDADDRFQKMVRITIRVLRRITRMLLDKYPSVHIIHAEGNHDLATSAMLREVWSQFYADEPRLTVETSPDPYYAYEWGACSLFFHHGHKRKPAQIDHVLASKFRKIWGRTEFSVGHMGHMHHDIVREGNLMHVEQHQTLAAPDSHASRGGWLSARSAKVISYHKRFGETQRFRLTPRMIGHE